MRILQLHAFYNAYIEAFETSHTGFDRQTYKRNIDQILLDGFSGGHLYAPYITEGQGTLCIYNWRSLQEKWFKEFCNVEKKKFTSSIRLALEQIQVIKPDILYISHPTDFSHHVFEQLDYRPKLIVGWRAANVPENIDWRDFDFILSHLSVCRDMAKARGAKETRHFFPGFPLFIAERLRAEEKKFDVVFSGHWSNEHYKRNEYIKSLCEYCTQNPGSFSLALFLAYSESHPPPPEVLKYQKHAVWGIEMYRVLKQARIVVNAEIDLASGEAGNMRLFETTGVGSFLLTEHHQNISDYFVPTEELETFSSKDELLDKVLYFLKHHEKRKDIALAGNLRCHREYSLQKRTKAFYKLMETLLESKGIHPMPGSHHKENYAEEYEKETARINPHEVSLEPVLAFIADGKIQEALDYLINLEQKHGKIPGLNFTKARIYLLTGLNQEDAIASLQKELIDFPENEAAKSLLQSIIPGSS